MTMRGLTSAYLMRRIWPLKAGDTILLHAAAAGVGLIVSQWAKLLGLTVIGTVSSEEKAAIARRHGCDHVINYQYNEVAKRVREITNGVGVSVVFDSVGRDTFAGSIDSLKRRGLLVCVGTSVGTRSADRCDAARGQGLGLRDAPALADYIADPARRARCSRALRTRGGGRIRIEINQRYRLQEAAQAHRDLEARRTTGSSIFVI
jgi:NADPH2:quinone reductase